MRREISSAAKTAATKIFVLFFFGVLMPFVILLTTGSIGAKLFQIFIFLPIGCFVVRWALRLKQVEISDDGLIVSQSHFGKRVEIFVPFAKIKNVSQGFFQHFNPETVKIEFNETTVFGDKIKFIPQIRLFAFLDHPIVEELNRKADEAEKATKIQF